MRASMLSRIVSSLLVVALVSSAARADDAAVARRHAQRASHLAASGKCRQAVAEYDKAIAVLRDPALLFNRAECHRKLGDADAALADYNQFLSDLPAAPNRVEVEARIAALKKKALATASAPISPPPQPAAPATRATAPVPARSPIVERAGSSPEPPAPRLQVDEAQSSKGDSLILAGGSSEAVPPSGGSSGSIVSRPWFWIAIGVVVIGAGVATYAVLGHQSTSIPASDLGNYRF